MRTIPVTTWNRALPLTRALDEMLGVNRLAGWLSDGERALPRRIKVNTNGASEGNGIVSEN